MDINHNIKSYVKWLAFTVLPFVVLISLQTYAQVSNTPLMEKMIVEPSVSNYKTIVANIFQEDDLFVLFYLNAALVVDPTKDSQVVERISSDNPWESLTQYLYGKSNIYFCPAGHQLSTAIEYMPCPIDPEIMMSDRYGMYRLSSPDELFKNRVGIFRNIHHKAVIFGGLKYDESSGQSSSSLLAFRGHRNLMLGYEYLKSTYDEAVYIDSIFRKNKIESALLIEENGTEAAFKQLSNYDVDILHVASHGFYEPKNDNREATSIQEWMMSHSGLILAGADNEYRGDGSNDGKLTAYEISRTDLTKIKLVVLSACDTGLGDVKENEVYGLLKGFKNAGAGTILLTLNEVSDTVTSLLMKRFYDNIFRGDNPRRALENAQRYIRLHGNGHFNHPKYWASFFLVDDLDRNIGENVSDEIRKSFLQDIVKLEDIYSEDKIFPNWEEIRTQLKPHEAIVRICPYSIGKDSIDYVALIGSHKSKQCQVVRLFSITNNKIGEYMIDLGSYGNLLNIIPFDVLDSIIWKPLIPYLHSSQIVYCHCSGILHGVPYEDLPSVSNKSVYRLSSLDRIIEKKKIRLNIQHDFSFVLFGGLYYDPIPEEFKNENINNPLLYRGYSYSLSYLPGTKMEVENIAHLLESAGFRYVTLFTKYNGTEEALTRLLEDSTMEVLHLSTHGFMLDYNNERSIYPVEKQMSISDYLLDYSGFCLSGANERLRGHTDTTSLDNIFLGSEIIKYDLSNVSLLVLSFCQPRLNGFSITSADETWDIIKACKVAGAKSILHSLWNVSDEATSTLMQLFYQNLIAGCSTHDALLKAKYEMKQEIKWNNPRYWASFVLTDAIK